MALRSVLLALAAGASVLTLASCAAPAAPAPAPAPTVTAPAADPADPPATTEPATPGATAAPVPELEVDVCAHIEEAPDGVYPVFDAGSATVVRAGDDLELRSVDAAAGWTSRVEDQDHDSVEIEFRQGTVQYDLDVEIDDGLFEAHICRDDD